MSDIKCPICQNNLHKINIIVSTCTNDKCKLWGSSIPNLVLEALAQTEQNLERTRKTLSDTIKLAEEMLEDIEYEGLCSWQYKEKLNKITALEQKDVK